MKYFKLLRTESYIKNLLIFIPFLVHEISYNSIVKLLLGFISFSFAASFGYIINDIIDVNKDRCHPQKKSRPIASCQIRVISGIYFSLILLLFSLIIALILSFNFFVLLLTYVFLTYIYTIKFKNFKYLDIIFLTIFFQIRMLCGVFILNDKISFWLLLVSIFGFLSLSMSKRRNEVLLQRNNIENIHRPYGLDDVLFLTSMINSLIVTSLFGLNFYFHENFSTSNHFLLLPMNLLIFYFIFNFIAPNNKIDDPTKIFYSNKIYLPLFIILCLIVYLYTRKLL